MEQTIIIIIIVIVVIVIVIIIRFVGYGVFPFGC